MCHYIGGINNGWYKQKRLLFVSRQTRFCKETNIVWKNSKRSAIKVRSVRFLLAIGGVVGVGWTKTAFVISYKDLFVYTS